MQPIEQDPDGYTAIPFEELMANPPGPDWSETRITDTDRALSQRYGPGAAWPPAAPTSGKGAAPFWVDRWDAMWTRLSQAGHTRKAQLDRFRRMTAFAQGLQGGGKPDVVALAAFRRNEAAAKAPVMAGVPSLPLWATTTELGLLLVYAASVEMQALVDTRQVAMLQEVGGTAVALMRLDAAVQVMPDQAPYWAWAAGDLGFLFKVADPVLNPGGPEGAPNPTSVVRPELPRPGARSR